MPGKIKASELPKRDQQLATVSEVAEALQIPQHVLRFWETKFPELSPVKQGNRRYYRPEDIEFLTFIRELLYDKGYTIKSVRKLIREGGWAGASPKERRSPRPTASKHGEDDAAEALRALVSPDPVARIVLVQQIREGFPIEFVENLAKLAGVDLDELAELGVIPRRTLAHSKQTQQFSPTQSDRAARFFRLFQKAKGTFGSEERAMHWLKRSTKPLQDNAPVSLLDTEEGARLVEDLLTRIDHGIAA